MGMIMDSIAEWLKEILVGGIISNLSGMFDSVNGQVGEIAVQVGTTPQAWNGTIYSMIRTLSENVMVPIAGVILAFVMTLELIQMVADKNNMHGDVDTWMFFKWIFKTAASVLIVTNTWNIVMGVFDVGQSVVNSAAGVIASDASIDISSVIVDMESRLMAMDLGPLFGLWFQSLFVGICTWALTICIFIITYGRMIEIYLVTSVAPQQGKRKHGTKLSALPVCSGVPGISHHCLRGDLCGTRPEHRRGYRHFRSHLDLHGVHGASVLYPVQDRFYGKIYFLGALRKETVYQ